MQARERIGLERHAFGAHELGEHGLQEGPRQGRVGHAVVAQGRDDPLHEPEEAFRVDGEARPDGRLAVLGIVSAAVDGIRVAEAVARKG